MNMVTMNYGTGTESDVTQTNYYPTSDYNSGRWIISYNKTPPLSLKEMMKLWAKERMRLFWENVERKREIPFRFVYDRPVPLRAVRLNGQGWAI